jgi:hypothetical protein
VIDVPSDSLRSVLDTVFAGRAYQWVEPPRPFAFLDRWWAQLQDWLTAFHDTNPQLFQAFFWALILILVLVFVHASYVLFSTIRAAGTSADVSVGSGVEWRDAAWHRREARRLAEQGRFAEAMPLDFQALVLELDARSVLRFQASKTPSEYAGEARLDDADRRMLREVVTVLYGVLFARRPLAPVEYDAWREQTDGNRYAAAH